MLAGAVPRQASSRHLRSVNSRSGHSRRRPFSKKARWFLSAVVRCGGDMSTSRRSFLAVVFPLLVLSGCDKRCPTCGGSGHVSSGEIACSRCAGKGLVSTGRLVDGRWGGCSGSGRTTSNSTCSGCRGSGTEYSETRCMMCMGTGERSTLSRDKRCQSCGGSGKRSVRRTCGRCGGKGVESKSGTCANCHGTGKAKAEEVERCSTCGGTGKVCPRCRGSGRK